MIIISPYFTATSLVSNTEYAINVAAVNAVGTGPAYNSSNNSWSIFSQYLNNQPAGSYTSPYSTSLNTETMGYIIALQQGVSTKKLPWVNFT